MNDFSFPSFWYLNSDQKIAFFEEGSAFVFDRSGRLLYDLKCYLQGDRIHAVFSDDASWTDLHIVKKRDAIKLQGSYFSYIKDPYEIDWRLKPCEKIPRPQARTVLQAVRFSDRQMIEKLADEQTDWDGLLIEAATNGHDHLIDALISKGARVNTFETPQEGDPSLEASLALTKAVQYGHLQTVEKLLECGANIHHKSFDLERDNLYHACFLYQVQPQIGRKVIELMLQKGADLNTMSAYYLTAVMYVFPEGPRYKAADDTAMMQRFIDLGIPLNELMTISATEQDRPLMYAAHMGLIKPLRLLIEAGADLWGSFEGINAYDRWLHPVLIDHLMPCQSCEEIGRILREAGLEASEDQFAEDTAQEREKESNEELISVDQLHKLFK